MKSFHSCSTRRGSLLGNTSSLLKNVRFFPDSPPDGWPMSGTNTAPYVMSPINSLEIALEIGVRLDLNI